MRTTYAQPRGLALKVSDEFTVPLCAIHHAGIHATSDERKRWLEQKIDPRKTAAELWRKKSRSTAWRNVTKSDPGEAPGCSATPPSHISARRPSWQGRSDGSGPRARAPKRLEGMNGIERREAGIFGVDEDEPVLAVDGALTRIDVASSVGHAWHIAARNTAIAGLRAGPSTFSSRQIWAIAAIWMLCGVAVSPNGAHEVALEHRKPQSSSGPISIDWPVC